MQQSAHTSELVGCFIVEVGQRQAWTYIGFADNRPLSGRETRLYIDAEWDLTPAIRPLEDDPILHLLELDGAVVAKVIVDESSFSLTIRFDDGPQLSIAGEPAFASSGAAWWLGSWSQ